MTVCFSALPFLGANRWRQDVGWVVPDVSASLLHPRAGQFRTQKRKGQNVCMQSFTAVVVGNPAPHWSCPTHKPACRQTLRGTDVIIVVTKKVSNWGMGGVRGKILRHCGARRGMMGVAGPSPDRFVACQTDSPPSPLALRFFPQPPGRHPYCPLTPERVTDTCNLRPRPAPICQLPASVFGWQSSDFPHLPLRLAPRPTPS